MARGGGFVTAGVGAGVVDVVVEGAIFDVATGLSGFCLKLVLKQ